MVEIAEHYYQGNCKIDEQECKASIFVIGLPNCSNCEKVKEVSSPTTKAVGILRTLL